MKEPRMETKFCEQERILSFGGAELLRDRKGRLEIVGGTEEEKSQAARWATKFLNNRCGLNWYSKAFTRRMKLPRLN